MRDAALVQVGSYLHRDEAEIARAKLAAAEIDALVRADDEGGLSPGFFTEFRVVLLVRPQDEDAARDLVQGQS